MVTHYRRRQYRDRRKFLESDIVASLKIGAHLFVVLFFLGFLMLYLKFGDPFINVFLGQ